MVINIGYLYKYGEILGLINISIVLSIIVLSILLYKLYREIPFFIMFSIYIIELGLCFTLGIYNYKDIINLENLNQLCIIYVLKTTIVITFRYKLRLSTKYDFMTILLSIINLFTINFNRYISLVIVIFINITYCKQFILDIIKQYTNILVHNKEKLHSYRSYINKLENKIHLEYDLQSKYKDEITNLNCKISKSIEQADIPMFILNINRECIYSNKAFINLISKDQIKKENLDILSYLDKKFLNSKRIMDIIDNPKNRNTSEIIRSNDNKVYRFICTTDVIEEQGIIICILNDITSSTIIQNKLKESEQRYKKLMDILNEGIIIHDEIFVSYINNKALELFDINETYNEIKLDDIKSSLNKKCRHSFLMNLDLIKLKKEDRITNKLETKSGKVIEFITTKLEFNQKRMFLSIIIDITDFENAIENIEQSEKTYKLLLHTLPEGIMIIDSKSRTHSYLNESMINILKNTGIENINKLIKRYIDEGNYGSFKKFTINNKTNTDMSIAIIDRKEEGNLLVIVRLLDHEYKMQKMKQELKNVSQKNTFKTEFLYKIINDIKDPINKIYNINNYISNNKEKYKTSYIENYTRLLRQNCYRLMRISNNIEQVNKLENGKYNLNPKKCDIVTLTKQIVNISQVYAKNKGIKMNFNSRTNKIVVTVDKEKIEKIILNILSNAIKFTDSGGSIYVDLSIERENICITIRDTGMGIPTDKLENIFESFEQVDRTLSRGAEGTGMGLYIVKKMSEIHNIKIDVNSKLGKGSEFKIIINTENQFKNLIVDNKLYCDISSSENVEMEFSDIYFDVN